VRKRLPAEEVGVGDDDFLARAVDGFQVGVLDVGAVPQVVAHQQRGPLRAFARKVEFRPQAHAPGPVQTYPGHPVPQPLGLLLHLRHQRAFHAHREVEARRHVPGCMHVVDDIDAAHKTDAGIQTAILQCMCEPRRNGTTTRPENQELYARRENL
jgi:hypothetical protein